MKKFILGAGECSVWWSDERSNGAPWLQDPKRFLDRIAPHCAQHGVVVSQHLLELLCLVVNHLVARGCAPESIFPVLVVVRLGLRGFRELNRECANTAAPAGMNTF